MTILKQDRLSMKPFKKSGCGIPQPDFFTWPTVSSQNQCPLFQPVLPLTIKKGIPANQVIPFYLASITDQKLNLRYKHFHMFQVLVHSSNDLCIDRKKVDRTRLAGTEHRD